MNGYNKNDKLKNENPDFRFYSLYREIFFRSLQHLQNMLCTKIVLNVKTKQKEKQQFVYTTGSEGILSLQFS